MKKLKAALMVACGVGMLLCTPVLAEEEQGTRENPYSWDDEIDFGTYEIGDSYVDLTLKLDGYLDTSDGTVADTYTDNSFSFEDDYMYIKGTIKTGDGSNDDDSLYTYLCSRAYSNSLNEMWGTVHIYDTATNTSTDSYTFTHSEYTIIISYNPGSNTMEDMSLLRMYYLLNDDDTYSAWFDISDMGYADENSETDSSELIDGMRPEFVAAMDEYEAFFDEYCEFMQTYMESDDTTALLSEYMDFMTQYSETMDALDAWEDEDLNDAELLYYTQVSLEISQKLLEVAAY